MECRSGFSPGRAGMSSRDRPAIECSGKVEDTEISASRPCFVSTNFAARASAKLPPTPAATMPASRTYFCVISIAGGP